VYALEAAKETVDFSKYDNGDKIVTGFVVVHAGSGAEQTGDVNDIWSIQHIFPGGKESANRMSLRHFATVPEDSSMGLAAHELGHLLFQWPDLYGKNDVTAGTGNWCLMGSGSWGGIPAGSVPTHPSAWCKVQQNWVGRDRRDGQ
jgi:immune inhibitor A